MIQNITSQATTSHETTTQKLTSEKKMSETLTSIPTRQIARLACGATVSFLLFNSALGDVFRAGDMDLNINILDTMPEIACTWNDVKDDVGKSLSGYHVSNKTNLVAILTKAQRTIDAEIIADCDALSKSTGKSVEYIMTACNSNQGDKISSELQKKVCLSAGINHLITTLLAGVPNTTRPKSALLLFSKGQAPSQQAMYETIGEGQTLSDYSSAYVNWALLQEGVKGTFSSSTKSWEHWGVDTFFPERWSIAVFDFGAGKGYVGFVESQNADGSFNILGSDNLGVVAIRRFSSEAIVAFRTAKNQLPLTK